MRLPFLLPALVLLVAACAPGRDLAPLPPDPAREYRLGPGDIVRIITYGEDPLTGSQRWFLHGIFG